METLKLNFNELPQYVQDELRDGEIQGNSQEGYYLEAVLSFHQKNYLARLSLPATEAGAAAESLLAESFRLEDKLVELKIL